MLAIEKPFPIVTASLGGIASLVVGFAGTVALLSAFMPTDVAKNPDTGSYGDSTIASTTNSDDSKSSPQQFTSTYATPGDTWKKPQATNTTSTSTAGGTTTSQASQPSGSTSTSTPVTATSPAPTGGMGSTTEPVPTAPSPSTLPVAPPTVTETPLPVITDPVLPVPTLPVVDLSDIELCECITP